MKKFLMVISSQTGIFIALFIIEKMLVMSYNITIDRRVF